MAGIQDIKTARPRCCYHYWLVDYALIRGVNAIEGKQIITCRGYGIARLLDSAVTSYQGNPNNLCALTSNKGIEAMVKITPIRILIHYNGVGYYYTTEKGVQISKQYSTINRLYKYAGIYA